MKLRRTGCPIVNDDFLEKFEAFFKGVGAVMHGAIMSTDNLYRYVLWRCWNASEPSMVFIMLNPSTADDKTDDPTIRRCINFAKREECGRLIVVNLFALRATNPNELLEADDPKGPDNRKYVENVIAMANGPVVAAWGAWWYTNQAKRYGKSIPRLAIEAFARDAEKPLYCLGRTSSNQPRHPLYVKSGQPLERFS